MFSLKFVLSFLAHAVILVLLIGCIANGWIFLSVIYAVLLVTFPIPSRVTRS